jgi:large subunit ribosomal protein L4
MQLDVVNTDNEKVGSLDLRDEVFGGRPRLDMVWEAVVHQNAGERRGTHATKNRALVSGSGRKPWRQKGTGRARVGEARNPLWRKGGTVFGPQPRDYSYRLPRKVTRGALREALTQKMSEGVVTVVDRLELSERKTRQAVELLARLGITAGAGKTLVLDVQPDEGLVLALRNLVGVTCRSTRVLTARDVMDTSRIVATRAALERLQEVLAS